MYVCIIRDGRFTASLSLSILYLYLLMLIDRVFSSLSLSRVRCLGDMYWLL